MGLLSKREKKILTKDERRGGDSPSLDEKKPATKTEPGIGAGSPTLVDGSAATAAAILTAPTAATAPAAPATPAVPTTLDDDGPPLPPLCECPACGSTFHWSLRALAEWHCLGCSPPPTPRIVKRSIRLVVDGLPDPPAPIPPRDQWRLRWEFYRFGESDTEFLDLTDHPPMDESESA